jgi:phytoene synthase
MNTTALPGELAKSRDYCRDLTRAYARNFYYGLRLLPEPKRSRMFALYAWMRLVDDIADADDGRPVAKRINQLAAWRADTHAVLRDGPDAVAPHDLWPAFYEMASASRMPPLVFDEMIAGQEQDLRPIAFGTWDELRQYCYRVAGVVGLASIYVWGFEGGESTEALAIDRGIAFQLTNILRDLREDAQRGRMYLPRVELAQANLNGDALLNGRVPGAFEPFMRRQIDRAEEHYRRSAPLEDRISADSRPTLVAMTQIYHELLAKMSRDPARVLRGRVSLSAWQKLRIGWRALRAK